MRTDRFYAMPAPRSNPDGRLMDAWIIREVPGTGSVPAGRPGRIVARFAVDGRDACERWLCRHPTATLHWRSR